MISNIKRRIAKIYFIRKMREILFELLFCRNVKKTRLNQSKIIFIMATPCHGNLGDHAIVYGEYKMLNKLGYGDNIIEIKNNDYLKYKNIINKYICLSDLIIIDGGGNLGTLWPNEDDKISEIIKTYSDNSIIVFPQTCYYDDSDESKIRLLNNQEIYSRAKNLCVFLRDDRSYNYFREQFKGAKSYYVPDIVLSIDNLNFGLKRSGCLLCFRKDLEKDLSDKLINEVKNVLSQNKLSYIETSTLVNYGVNKKNRNKELTKKWKEFASSQLVITDRLHGMIFSAITGTPCLAFDNVSHKVVKGYKWISNLQYIKIYNNMSDIKEIIELICNLSSDYTYDISDLLDGYSVIEKEVNNAFN